MRENAGPGVESTIEFIKILHEGIYDDTGLPYWTHPVAVMEMLPEDADDDERLAALLHDTIEDTGTTEDDLRARGYSERTIELVSGVSRNRAPEGMTYIEWIRWIAASEDIARIRLKLNDNRHNSDRDRIAAIPDTEKRKRAEDRASNRYARSMKILGKALAALESRPGPCA